VVDEEAVGVVLVEVVEGQEVEGEESDRRENVCVLGSCASTLSFCLPVQLLAAFGSLEPVYMVTAYYDSCLALPILLARHV
jgi:hypothetical protein